MKTGNVASQDTTLLIFDGMERPVALVGAGELTAEIADVLRGWQFRDAAGLVMVEPVITVSKTGTDYHLKSPWSSGSLAYANEIDVIGDFLPNLIESLAVEPASGLSIRAVAVTLDQGLVIIPSADRLEKTLISVHLIAAGGRLFASDIARLDFHDNVIAAGVSPQVPIPVPKNEGERFRNFIREREGRRGEKHLFLDLPRRELAPFGTAAPICGVVLLRHGSAKRSELMPATEAEVLKELIPVTSAKNLSPLDKLDRLRTAIEGTRCFNLRFTTGEETVRLLQDEFGPVGNGSAANPGPPWKDDPSLDGKKLYGRSHALVIGVAECTNGWRCLRTPVRDAKRVADEFRHRGFDVNCRMNVTGKAMREELRTFFAEKGADPQARLFLWFSGHGHKVESGGFLVPADAPPPMSREEFASIALHMRELGDLVRLAKAKHVLCVIDSCTPCTIFDPQKEVPHPAIFNETALPVRQFITAGDHDSYVSDDGSFCTMFLRALRGEEAIDADGDGNVTGSEIGAFLADRLAEITDGAQLPRYGKLDGNSRERGDFVFSLPATGT